MKYIHHMTVNDNFFHHYFTTDLCPTFFQNNLAFRSLDLIKAQVEGHEVQMLLLHFVKFVYSNSRSKTQFEFSK